MDTILVTGGAGFIGSKFVHLYLRDHPQDHIVNLDKLTYAGNPANIADLTHEPRHMFVKGDIKDDALVRALIGDHGISRIVNFAAESHVDRSIAGPLMFFETNVLGTQVLLEAARDAGIERFVQVSTDEVYGSLAHGAATEESALHPSSPYAVSKASADLLTLSYVRTFGLRAVITRSSNNFGPNQYPEKLIPLFITNLIEGKDVPVYGTGRNVRDWIYVDDNCKAIEFVLEHGADNEIYNISGGNERTNLEITHALLDLCGCSQDRIAYVKDRPGHDWRYAIDGMKLRALGWQARHGFERALEETVRWYKNNPQWWQSLKRTLP